jgi:hypothetical protein
MYFKVWLEFSAEISSRNCGIYNYDRHDGTKKNAVIQTLTFSYNVPSRAAFAYIQRLKLCKLRKDDIDMTAFHMLLF